tara:strand:+ start:6 stop:191 length:186 start_codon:yes stop_codon:yes gene_type:complete
MRFGLKNRKLVRFGSKAMKAGVFGRKVGGKLNHMMGTAMKHPHIMSAVAKMKEKRQGLEKM